LKFETKQYNFPENLRIGLWRFFWTKRTSNSTSGW